MDKNILYQQILQAYVTAYLSKSKKICQADVILQWN